MEKGLQRFCSWCLRPINWWFKVPNTTDVILCKACYECYAEDGAPA